MHVLSLPVQPARTLAKGTRVAAEKAKEEAEMRRLFLRFPALLFLLLFFVLKAPVSFVVGCLGMLQTLPSV